MTWQDEVLRAWGVEVLDARARGGAATVYQGLQRDLQRKVALKVVRASFEPELLERFQREARIIAKLSHRNIVAVHNFGVFDDAMILMMPWYDKSLRDVLTRGPLGAHEVRRILNEIGAALQYAHAHDVIHRDVKPANIMVAEDGSYVLTDFGIASATGDTRLTRTGAVPGTPDFLAPEVIQGGDPSAASDLYAFGATLFEAAAGTKPFASADPISAAYLAVHADVPRLDIPHDPSLATIIAALLSKHPQSRSLTQPDVTESTTSRTSRRFALAGVLALVFVAGWLLLGRETHTSAACDRDAISDPANWVELTVVSPSLGDEVAGMLTDGSRASDPALSSPGGLAEGDEGNTSLLLETPAATDIAYVAAAFSNVDPSAVPYVRLCSREPCGRDSGDRTHPFSAAGGGFRVASPDASGVRLVRVVWPAGTSAAPTGVTELCAARG